MIIKRVSLKRGYSSKVTLDLIKSLYTKFNSLSMFDMNQ